tara:strand:- start:54731 stop:55018 length:288 start_codon:yes stop_codon:yes gene_type:complete
VAIEALFQGSEAQNATVKHSESAYAQLPIDAVRIAEAGIIVMETPLFDQASKNGSMNGCLNEEIQSLLCICIIGSTNAAGLLYMFIHNGLVVSHV